MNRQSDKYVPNIHLYAEHLQNIRTLSIQASLSTVSNQATKATLSADGHYLTVEHEGEKVAIRLPVSLGSHGDATLTIPAAPTKDLTFRLNVGQKPETHDALSNSVHKPENIIPWMAGELTPETAVSCATCHAEIVRSGQIRQWKDLPSEGWAEMMDFWHCHKPDEPHDHAHEAENVSRGFAANSRLTVRPGMGLVGPMDFLFAAEDCSELEVRPCDSRKVSPICSPFSSRNAGSKEPAFPGREVTITKAIGVLDPSTEGFKLRKPCLSIAVSQKTSSRGYSHEKWLSSALLTAAESQGVMRLALHASDWSSGHPISMMHTWLFAPDLVISSSAADTKAAIRVVKVLYREGVSADIETLGKMGSAEGELEFSKEEWCEMRSLLDRSAELLPGKARRFQQWNVGLLRRFVEDDVSDMP
ncbi:hypothetical protein LTR91_020430 [Friedmanniomyces endolithicus]|uniref:Ubiquitin-conjugating enzyme E2-binding protein n=2 Tax=Dothideomycetidae TaxID=451867 RepID=A0AAN6K3T9_9PEZI|nr:hypothetical protein LTS09_008503 [Friedmanniomyces endolithicus]KAK5143015.1 hypothetical protein LTR32_004770 [Rachicladosporium monterosium]KAK0362694.1 hypothetical protein LTR94_018446 [Friedmanniomyces endolithicus]KAK0774691.1 hypothetical protein LTR59_014810 [Friedmanniomyces endolithicus]KAK0774903.1 hypothetical protein LTR38_016060 [Friedmanniomyces endolithicus]